MKTRIPEQAALGKPEQDELEYEAKLAALLVLIDEGDACDPATDVDGEEFMEQLRQRIVDRAAVQTEGRVATIKLRQTGGKEEVER